MRRPAPHGESDTNRGPKGSLRSGREARALWISRRTVSLLWPRGRQPVGFDGRRSERGRAPRAFLCAPRYLRTPYPRPD